MEPPIVYYPRSEYIETDTGNKVSRKSVICGSQNIILGGKTIIQTDCVIRGDLRRTGGGHAVVVAIGRYCLLAKGSIIRPPYKTYKGTFSYYPMKIGDHVSIGEGSIVEAATIGSFVHIGKNCVIGRFAIIKDCCKIEDNTVIPPNTVVPSFSIYEGSPGVFVDELPECVQDLYELKTKDFYIKFQPKDSWNDNRSHSNSNIPNERTEQHSTNEIPFLLNFLLMFVVIIQALLIRKLFFDTPPHDTKISSVSSSTTTTTTTTEVASSSRTPRRTINEINDKALITLPPW